MTPDIYTHDCAKCSIQHAVDSALAAVPETWRALRPVCIDDKLWEAWGARLRAKQGNS